MSSLPMIFVRPDELPMIGKFDEAIHLDKAKQPIRMYFKEEELIEEVIDDNIKKDSEYWKRRRQRRRAVKAKSQLVIEDVVAATRDKIGPLKGLMYEGKMSNLNLTDGSATEASSSKAYQNKEKAKSSTEAPFKFVMLQPHKIMVDGKEQTQILVTPVGDWFSFKKPSITGQKLLDEIDDDYDNKLIKDKALLSKYKKIEQAFATDGQDEVDYDGLGKSTSTSSSTTAANRKRQLAAAMNSNAPYDAFSLPVAFGRGAATSKSSFTAGRRGGAGGSAASRKILEGDGVMERGGVSSSESEAVADRDAEEEMDEWVGGDYDKTYADDDEANVGEEQMMLNDREEFMAAQEVDAEDENVDAQFDKDGRLIALERTGGSGYGEDEDEEDDEGEYEGEYETEGVGYEEGTGCGSSSATTSSGMVDLDMERGAREYRRVMIAQERQHEQRYQQRTTQEEETDKNKGDVKVKVETAVRNKKRDRNSSSSEAITSSSSSSALSASASVSSSATAVVASGTKDVATTLTLKKARPSSSSSSVSFAADTKQQGATATVVASAVSASSSVSPSVPPTVAVVPPSSVSASLTTITPSSTSISGTTTTIPVTARTTATISTIATSSTASVTSKTVELTEESVRGYISSLGGKVTVAALKESYNKKVKEMNKLYKATSAADGSSGSSSGGGGAGSKKLVEILLKLTVTEDDPLLGKVLKLRSTE